MPTLITNRATATYNSGAVGATAVSNLATATLLDPLTLTKTSLGDTYTVGEPITYIITYRNTGGTTLTGVTLKDNLGGGTTLPLGYVGPAQYYLNGLYVSTVTGTPGVDGVDFTMPDIPAGGVATLIYRATPNTTANPGVDGSITNTATLNATGITAVTASATVTAAQDANLVIRKDMSPDELSPGDTLTYTFTLLNYGNSAATNIVLTDVFDPEPQSLTVTVGGAPFTDFTYTGGTLTLPTGGAVGTVTVPAATFAQGPGGAYTTTPGTLTITASGVITR